MLLAALLAGQAQSPSSLEISGTVRNDAGQPVAGASITLSQSGQAPQTATSAADGTFHLRAAQAGAVTVRAEKSGAGSAEVHLQLPFGRQSPVDLTVQATKAQNSGGIEFNDEPTFTVAGVTDNTAAGGHGSGEVLRTSEALAQETVKLGSGVAGTTTETAALQKQRDALLHALAQHDSAEGRRQLGDVYEQMGESLAAEREYEAATRLSPAAENYLAWGGELLLHRAIVPAAEVFRKGSAAHPQSATLLTGWAAALYAAGSGDDAARKACEAADLAPADPRAYYFLGKMQVATPTALPCAEDKLARLAQLRPADALGLYYYAVALMRAPREAATPARAAQAESLLRRAAALDPALAEVPLQLGILLAEQGNDAAAIEAWQHAATANPNLAEAHYRLASAYKRTGKPELAQQELQRYKQLQQDEAAAAARRHKELQQFVVVLKAQPDAAPKP